MIDVRGPRVGHRRTADVKNEVMFRTTPLPRAPRGCRYHPVSSAAGVVAWVSRLSKWEPGFCCCCCCSPGNRTRPGPRSRHDGATCSPSTHFRSHCVTQRGSEHSELTELASKQWLKPCLQSNYETPRKRVTILSLYLVAVVVPLLWKHVFYKPRLRCCCVRVSTDGEDNDVVLYHCRREREQPSWTSWRRWSWRSSSSGRGREPSSRMHLPVQERVQSECLTPLRALCDVI